MSSEMQDIDEDFRICNAQSEYVIEFEPPPFRLISTVDTLHNRSPRFGHSNDINLLIQGNRTEQKDYLTGLLAASFAVFCLFVVWMFLLLVFRCLGPSRVGFLSARRQLPTKPVKPEAVYRQERVRKKQPFQRNGEAGGYEGSSPNNSKKAKLMLKPVVGVAKAPITVVSKARKRKRELEKRNQFSKMKNDSFDSEDDLDDVDMDMDETENTEQAPPNISIVSSSTDVITEADRKIIRQYEQDWKEYERLIYKNLDRIRRIRIGAGFCAIGILISALMFTIMTEKELTTSLDIFDASLNQVDNIIQAALTTSLEIAERQAMAHDSTSKFLLQINDICPNTIDQLCTNINDESATTADERGCDFSTIPYGEELANMVQVLDTTFSGVLDGLEDFAADLTSLQSLLSEAYLYYPKHGAWVFWTAAGCSLALGCVGLFLTGGMVYLEMEQQPNGMERNLPKSFSFFRSWFMVPLFLLLAIISWAMSMSFIFLGTGSSDLCYNSPDVPVLNMLEEVEDDFNSMILLFLRYYVAGCPAIQAPTELEASVVAIQTTVLPSLGNLIDAVRTQGEEMLEETCGVAVTPLLAIVSTMGNQICALGLSISDLRALLQCELWYPLYRATMYDSICTNATQGFAWAAATQIVIVLLSMVLLTLRVSYYELDEVLETDETSASGGGGCCCCSCFRSNKGPTGHIGEINIKKQAPPINSHIGEINIKKQAPPINSHIGEINIKKQTPPLVNETKIEENKEDEVHNIDADASSGSSEYLSESSSGSGSIEEISLKE